MAQPLLVSHILCELAVGFSAASLLVLGVLRVAAVDFPLLATLQITFVWTLVVYATMRATGVLSGLAHPTPEAGSMMRYRKDDLGPDAVNEIKA